MFFSEVEILISITDRIFNEQKKKNSTAVGLAGRMLIGTDVTAPEHSHVVFVWFAVLVIWA